MRRDWEMIGDGGLVFIRPERDDRYTGGSIEDGIIIESPFDWEYDI